LGQLGVGHINAAQEQQVFRMHAQATANGCGLSITILKPQSVTRSGGSRAGIGVQNALPCNAGLLRFDKV